MVCLGKLASAQTTDTLPPAKDTSINKGVSEDSKAAYITVQGGNVMEVKDNKVSKLEKDKTLKDGTVILTDGTVKATDGTTRKLKEGERIYVDGKSGGQ